MIYVVFILCLITDIQTCLVWLSSKFESSLRRRYQMKKITLVATSLLICSGAAFAQNERPVAISTQELYSVCADQSNPESQIYCDIYGQGVYDTYLVTRHPRSAPNFICVVQPAPTRRQVMNHFVEWVVQNPSYDRAPAADSLLRYLSHRFPCDSPNSYPPKAPNRLYR